MQSKQQKIMPLRELANLWIKFAIGQAEQHTLRFPNQNNAMTSAPACDEPRQAIGTYFVWRF